MNENDSNDNEWFTVLLVETCGNDNEWFTVLLVETCGMSKVNMYF